MVEDMERYWFTRLERDLHSKISLLSYRRARRRALRLPFEGNTDWDAVSRALTTDRGTLPRWEPTVSEQLRCLGLSLTQKVREAVEGREPERLSAIHHRVAALVTEVQEDHGLDPKPLSSAQISAALCSLRKRGEVATDEQNYHSLVTRHHQQQKE